MEIGAQLYTVRDFCKTTEDLAETLKKIAEIGYKNVQVSGTCEYEAEWLAAELKKNGLKCVITHTPPAKLLADAKKVAADHTIFGCDYVGLGGYRFDETEPEGTYENFVKTYTPVIEALQESGKYFMYHNHAREFQKLGDKLIMQHLADHFSSEVLGFTLDTYWVQVGGGDPAEWIRKLSGRVPCIHLKDCAYGPKMAVVGEGNINFDRVFEEAEKAGTQYMLVEQDDCNGEDPFACLTRSYQYLKSRGFE